METIFSIGVGPIEKDKCAIFRKNCAIAEKSKQNGVGNYLCWR